MYDACWELRAGGTVEKAAIKNLSMVLNQYFFRKTRGSSRTRGWTTVSGTVVLFVWYGGLRFKSRKGDLSLMGLFDKMKEPVFLKESSNAAGQLEKLKALESKLNDKGKKKLRQEIRCVEYGIAIVLQYSTFPSGFTMI